MQKVLVMTDLHLTPEGSLIIGLDPGARLAEVLADAADAHPDAVCLVLCGDLTHNGTAAEYARLRACLAAAPWPVIPMLGNHDDRGAFRAAFPEAEVTQDGHVMTAQSLGETVLITLDTLIGPPFGQTDAGRFDASRRAWLEAELAGAGDRQVLVFAHHPPMALGIPAMDAIALQEGDWLIDRLRAHPGPVHLIVGHVHRTVSGQVRGLPFTLFKGTCHQGPLALTSMDSTLSIDEPAAYGVILIGDNQIVAHSQDVGLGAEIRSYGAT